MRNFLRAALVIGTLASPMIVMADTPAAKDAPKADTTKTADKAPATKDAPKTDTKTDTKTTAKTKAPAKTKTTTKAPAKTDAPKADTKAAPAPAK